MNAVITGVAALSLLLVSSDAPEWRAKPVQCASPESVIQYYVEGGALSAEFVGVAQIVTQDSEMQRTAIVFWLNRTTGEWMLMEGDSSEVCIISLGTHWQNDVDTDRLITQFTGKTRL